mgnify:CR=1 FL=1
MLKVTNTGAFDLIDRFAGEDYVFPAGKSLEISEDAARHIFGFGDHEKRPYLVRLGWLKFSQDYDDAMQKMGAFVFGASGPEVEEDLSEAENEQGLAPLQIGAGEEAATDGVVESSVPIPPPTGKGRSILEQLQGG